MDVQISPSPLRGVVKAIPSKSDAHRLLICAALADNPTEIEVPETSQDIDATVSCLRALGADIKYKNGIFYVTPIGKIPESPYLDCGESGSLLRFILPVVSTIAEKASFDGHGRLPERPIGELVSVMEEHGVVFSSHKLPLSISGKMSGGDFYLPGNISSQYITGLLLSLPNTKDGGNIHLTTELESAAYVDMTLFALSRFGIEVTKIQDGWHIPGGQKFKSPGKLQADGDWSNSAFFLTAGAICGEVTVSGLDVNSTQGDKKILEILSRFGAEVSVSGNNVTVKKAPLHGCNIDLKNIPDLLPTLAVAAAFSDGTTVFTGGARLRIKESDRLKTVCALVNSLGGIAAETDDGIIVKGSPISGGVVNGSGDHRIVMAASIAGTMANGNVTILGADAADKSYPGFFGDFKLLGGKCNVI
jgi:3-phosphoshikimate 1-carboxyvinyltransferase